MTSPGAGRRLVFEPTPAVAASRERQRFIACSVCQTDNSAYLFHKTGVRFVRCKTCGLVYVNPVSDDAVNYFDIEAIGQLATAKERKLCLADFDRFLARIEADYEAVAKKPLRKAVLLGRFLDDFEQLPAARRIGLEIARIDDAAMRDLAANGSVAWAKKHLGPDVEVVILHELLEGAADSGTVLDELTRMLSPAAWLVVTYTNAESIPARLMRRYWPPFFDVKTAFFNTNNLTALMSRYGFVLTSQCPFPVTHTTEYFVKRVAPKSLAAKIAAHTPLGSVTTPIRAGNRVAYFRKRGERGAEKLSIVLPVYNEAKSCGRVIEAVLAKELKIPKEVVIVESNSTDGTRDVVRAFEGRPGVKVLYEDAPRGKGHAVRTGLSAVTGTIILIQDADFEYDIDDYDGLLEPILQHRATFVLGSRSLGLDDWKVRKFSKGSTTGAIMNLAQVVFAKTYNVLYQQHVTDVNTMFKVFRAECLDGLDLESDGFELDIELACKLAKNGNAPMEVPVNYVSRGFDEGKKITWRDAPKSYSAFLRYRFK